MERSDLPEAAQAKLDVLLVAIKQVLDDTKTDHERAVSVSSLEPGSTVDGVFNGGSVTPPQMPPFEYREHEMMLTHQAVFRVAPSLHALIVHARRIARGNWELRTRLVSIDEHKALTTSRRPIDKELAEELERIFAGKKWEHISFGRSNRAKPPALVHKPPKERVVRMDPTPALLELLSKSDAIYRAAGLEPVIANWTLRSGKIDFREYFE